MSTNSSSTADAISEIAGRLGEVLETCDGDRRDRVAKAVARFEHLVAKGLIKKSRYVAPAANDLRRLYLKK